MLWHDRYFTLLRYIYAIIQTISVVIVTYGKIQLNNVHLGPSLNLCFRIKARKYGNNLSIF